ncbi:hypothetical protein [Paenibacillus sp. JZ16]|uniref:hypothetical protein n=1 Tax=Paenibacillus sp. JZ16 TaxID=1906272 RepID=UPI00188D2B59|nr:hypothetical protein [Paenibacillus sp. JZ16]
MEQNLISMHSWNGNALSYTCDKFLLLLFRLVQYHHSAHSGVVIHRELAQFSCGNFEFEDKNEELDQLMSILDSVSYTRSPRSFFNRNIRNDGGPTFAFIIFYRDRDGEMNDYFLDMNQGGYVLRGGKKMYKMVDREKEVFDQLSTWLFEKAVRMPVT